MTINVYFLIHLNRVMHCSTFLVSFPCCYSGVQRHLVVTNCYSQTRHLLVAHPRQLVIKKQNKTKEMCRRLASVGLRVHLLIYCSLYSWYDRLLYLLLMSLPCTIPWPCICRAYTVHIWKKKSFSFDIMVDVNVYKLYSTCINTCLHGRCGVGSSVNRFIIFLREVWGNYIKNRVKKN